jgi:hypothetical protein
VIDTEVWVLLFNVTSTALKHFGDLVPGQNLPVVVSSCGFHPGSTELSKDRALIFDGCLGNLGTHPSNCASSYQWRFCLLKSPAIETVKLSALEFLAKMTSKQFRAGKSDHARSF